MKNIIIAGGGLAGLIASIALAKAGIPSMVIERKAYPFHRVCGEFISNETVPYLKSLDVYPEQFSPPQISRFQLSGFSGKSETLPLDMGGFGISRFTFDQFLYQHALRAGVEFRLNTEIESIHFEQDQFHVKTQQEELTADVVIGAHGKRSRLDVQLDRSFIKKRSPYVGIKYHLRLEHPDDLIALHNFPGGYCGISNIEDGKTNICYLTHRDNLKTYKDIGSMQEAILYQNPLLKYIFLHADFLFDKPEVINEISFETKSPVSNHILMAGDAAGMITPLCGNGMAMAIHAAKIASELVTEFNYNKNFSRGQLEMTYAQHWKNIFATRLWGGRQIQRLFGHPTSSNLAVNLALYVKPVAKLIIKNTHGEVF